MRCMLLKSLLLSGDVLPDSLPRVFLSIPNADYELCQHQNDHWRTGICLPSTSTRPWTGASRTILSPVNTSMQFDHTREQLSSKGNGAKKWPTSPCTTHCPRFGLRVFEWPRLALDYGSLHSTAGSWRACSIKLIANRPFLALGQRLIRTFPLGVESQKWSTIHNNKQLILLCNYFSAVLFRKTLFKKCPSLFSYSHVCSSMFIQTCVQPIYGMKHK